MKGLEIFKDGRTDHGPTDGPQTEGQGRLLRTPSGEPRVQNGIRILQKSCSHWQFASFCLVSSEAKEIVCVFMVILSGIVQNQQARKYR